VALVPRPLLARWADLPALAWLAANRFGGAAARIPVFGRVCAAIGWVGTLVVLAGARADRACAAHGRVAVLTVRQRWPRRSRWVRHVVFVAALPAGVGGIQRPSPDPLRRRDEASTQALGCHDTGESQHADWRRLYVLRPDRHIRRTTATARPLSPAHP